MLTTGATPLMLLDYVAASEIELEQVAELVEGAAEVCRAAGVALVGGETAELPGIYRDGELDFAGTCVGHRRPRRARRREHRGRAGDAVIGFASAGVHANGFTLVRRVLETEDYDGPDLLAPTRLYLDEARALRGRAKAFAHVTGGGILGNLSRVVPDGLEAEIDWDVVAAAAGLRVARAARRRGRAAPRLQPRDRLVRRRRRARAGRARDRADPVIGVLVSGNGTNLQALIDAGLPIAAVASNRKDAYALMRARTARIPTAVFALDCHADREERDLDDGDLARGARRGARRARRLHAPADAAVPRAVPAARRERPPLAAAGVSRERTRSRTRSRPGVETTGVTVHLVDEGIDTGPVLRQEAVAVEPA